VLGALTDLTAFLKGEDVSTSSYVDQIKSSFSDENDQQSFALRLVIHYVGDIHQPLHSVSGVSDEYPKGDRGGNSEWIDPNIDGVGNLHSVYDSVIYKYTGYPDLPLDGSDWDWYTSTAEDLASQFPVSSSELHAGDFQQWADESVTLAKTYVYPDFVNHEVPSDEYQQSRLPVMQSRLMVGGARLAALIEDIYGSNSTEATYETFTEKVFSTMLQ